MRVFKSMRVWLVVQTMPGALTRDLVEVLPDLAFRQVKDSLQWLREYGCVVNRGTTRRAKWYATDKRPVDMRGSGLKSMTNLKKNAGRWGRVVYRRPLIKPNRPPPKVRPSTELERCWPILGVIRHD